MQYPPVRRPAPRRRPGVRVEPLEGRLLLSLTPPPASTGSWSLYYTSARPATPPHLAGSATGLQLHGGGGGGVTPGLVAHATGRHASAAAPSHPAVRARALATRHDRPGRARPEVGPPGTARPFDSSPDGYEYTPAQVAKAYGFDQVAGRGAGQTIAVVDAYNDPTIVNDLAVFDAQFGIPQLDGRDGDGNFSIYVQGQSGSYSTAGTPPPDNPSWGQEISLDVEWAHALAPLANIVLMEAYSTNFTDLLSGDAYAANLPGVVAVSNSFGGGEFFGEASLDSSFATPAGHPGVTFLASTGDGGAGPGAQYPAASPDVLAVGGTTLLTSTLKGRYGVESGWGGSGGGTSQEEPVPSFQAGLGFGGRSIPDVSFLADPATGVAVYDSTRYAGNSDWYRVGGTSFSSPAWGSIIALADGARASAGKAPLDGPSQTIPALYGIYNNASSYASTFHDVTTGSNGLRAGAGYDQVTGIGTPLVPQVVAALAGV